MQSNIHYKIGSLVYLLLHLLIFSCSSEKKDNKTNPYQIKIGFGSCLKQNNPMPIFQSIKKENFDLFLMIGDNVYGDTEKKDLKELKLAYEKQKKNFKELELNFPLEAIWDDHDYGRNDAGKEYPFKKESKELFLKFWNVPKDDERRTRPGLYYARSITLGEKRFQLLFLDTRTFRDSLIKTDKYAPGKERYISNNDASATILGKNQWKWLQNKFTEHADYRIIISSIQFLPIGHGWESWNNFPHERKKLITFIEKHELKNILFISGDRHRGGIYQLKTETGKTISEITSSSLNASFSGSEEFGPLRIGKTFIEENYGSIIINSSNDVILVDLKNMDGKILKSLKI